MKLKRKILVLTALVSALSAGYVFAADPPPAEGNTPTQEPGKNDARQFITPQERMEHYARMRAASTDEERKQIRKEYYELMKKRAKAHGMTLPDV